VASDLAVVASIAVDGTTVTVKADLTAAQTGALAPSPPDSYKNYTYRFVATTSGGSIVTLGTGKITVQKGITA